MNQNIKYDYIIAGAGLSGLLLAMELQKTSLKNKRILLIDREVKNNNDRTWCFWNDQKDFDLDEIVYKKWNKIRFASTNSDGNYPVAPYTYQYIRGNDFYDYANKKLRGLDNVTFILGEITEISPEGYVIVNNQRYEAELVFNSMHEAIDEKTYASKDCYYLLQHFKGYFLTTDRDVFDPDCATFMDFDIEQKKEARFGYILPFSNREALVEYTLFSQNLLKEEEYEQELKAYIKNKLGLEHYSVSHEEFGIVPMSTYAYGPKINGKIVHIGTRGGFVKPSSGFAFHRTFKRIKKLAQQLAKTGQVKPSVLEASPKYKFYDNILLSILEKDNTVTRDIFEKMFTNVPASTILRFLDEESTLLDDLRVMTLFAGDTRFLRAAMKQMGRLIV
jgi:lycopene beta-cyclase